MNMKAATIGSIIAAFVASLCCIGPLLLGGAGLGAALVSSFAPLRPYVLALSAVLLAGGFFYAYRKPKTGVACSNGTCRPQNAGQRMAKPLLWLSALVVAALALFPYYGSALIRAHQAAPSTKTQKTETAQLKIAGMDCEVCAATIQRKLLETPGVVKAEVRYPAGSATVQFNPSQTDTSKLIAVVKDTGYKAAVSNSAQE